MHFIKKNGIFARASSYSFVQPVRSQLTPANIRTHSMTSISHTLRLILNIFEYRACQAHYCTDRKFYSVRCMPRGILSFFLVLVNVVRRDLKFDWWSRVSRSKRERRLCFSAHNSYFYIIKFFSLLCCLKNPRSHLISLLKRRRHQQRINNKFFSRLSHPPLKRSKETPFPLHR